MNPALDTTLSWRARGLLAFCLACRGRITRQRLIESGDIGFHAVINTLRELEKAGYARRIIRREKTGKLSGQQWVFKVSKFKAVVTKHVTSKNHRRYKNTDDGAHVTTEADVTKNRTTVGCNNGKSQQTDLWGDRESSKKGVT